MNNNIDFLCCIWYHKLNDYQSKGTEKMPKKADNTLKTDSGIYKSKLRASQAYDKNSVDNIRVRVPKGWKEQMQEYVQKSDRYSSINGMICDLIRKEIGFID